MDMIKNIMSADEFEKLNEFFEEIYYDHDLVQYRNCFDYAEGRVNIFDVIDTIREFDLKINIEYKY